MSIFPSTGRFSTFPFRGGCKCLRNGPTHGQKRTLSWFIDHMFRGQHDHCPSKARSIFSNSRDFSIVLFRRDQSYRWNSGVLEIYMFSVWNHWLLVTSSNGLLVGSIEKSGNLTPVQTLHRQLAQPVCSNSQHWFLSPTPTAQ